MSEWRECKLGEVAAKIGSGATPRGGSNDYKIEGISLIRSQNILDFQFSSSGLAFIDEEQADGLKNVNIEKNDVLLNITGDSVARCCIVPENILPARVNQHVAIIRLNPRKADYKYIFYTIQALKEELLMQSEIGATRKALTKGMIESLNILLPPLPEQKAIASVLSSLDDKIDLLHRQNKTLEVMAETLFRQWFLEEADEEWEEKELGELMTITSSKRIFYSEYTESGIPFYRSKEIIELHNTGSTRSELYITENRFNEIEEKFGAPIAGDILLTSVGTLGIPYRVKKNDKFYFKDGNLTWFKNFSSVPSIIIYCWLRSSIGKEQLEGITIGSTQSALTISGLKSIKIVIPPVRKLKSLKDNLVFIYNKIDANQSQIRTLEKLRDTLLPKLMSGEVRVK